MSDLEVLFEDNHCLAVNKPAGMLSQRDISGDPSVVDRAGAYLKSRYAKPGNVYVGLLHRLDRPVSGVILLAKTSKAASRLSAQLRSGTIRKLYWAVVEGWPADEGEWVDFLDKDKRINRTEVVSSGAEPGKEARLSYRVVRRWKQFASVELEPATGRSHQLRVQLASRGYPIAGDGKYGAGTRLAAVDGRRRIALHARELTFMHPTLREAISVAAPLPADWPAPFPPSWE